MVWLVLVCYSGVPAFPETMSNTLDFRFLHGLLSFFFSLCSPILATEILQSGPSAPSPMLFLCIPSAVYVFFTFHEMCSLALFFHGFLP